MTYITDYAEINDMDTDTGWTQTGDLSIKINASGSVPQIWREGTGCHEGELGSGKSGYYTLSASLNLTAKAIVFWNWLTGPVEMGELAYWTNRVYDGTTWVDYDFLPEMLVAAVGGWFPGVVWPTPSPESHITNSGTPVVSSIDSIEYRGSNTGSTNIKTIGIDIIGSVGYVGAHSQTVTLDQLATEAKTNHYGVLTQTGATSFKVQCIIRYGGGTGTTSVTETGKTVDFKGANEDHPVGYEIVTGGTTNITLTDMIFNWAFPQPVFKLTSTPALFRFEGCQFNGGGVVDLPAYSVITARHVKTTKFNDCGRIETSDITFEDNTIVNADIGVFVQSTSHRMKNNTYDTCVRAMQFPTAGTYSIDGDEFINNTYDIHFSAETGNLILNVTNSANPPSPLKVDNDSTGTVTINNNVTVTQKVTTSTGVPIQNARVFLRAKDATGPFPFEESITLTRSGIVASAAHTAHGLATGDKVVIKGTDQEDYNGVKTITVTGVNAYNFTVTGNPTTPATGPSISTFVVLHGLTDVNGEITVSRTYPSDQPFTGVARLSTSSPFYKSGDINNTVDNVTGYSGAVSLVLDE